jgi:hypothetical protein
MKNYIWVEKFTHSYNIIKSSTQSERERERERETRDDEDPL